MGAAGGQIGLADGDPKMASTKDMTQRHWLRWLRPPFGSAWSVCTMEMMLAMLDAWMRPPSQQHSLASSQFDDIPRKERTSLEAVE